LFNQIGQRFRRAVASFAEVNDIPWVKFGKDDVGGKLELMGPHLDRQAATGQSGVPRSGWLYQLTHEGICITVFYTKIYNRMLVPLTAANRPQAPPELRAALATITRHVDAYVTRARISPAA
jgi:hypothetical protein